LKEWFQILYIKLAQMRILILIKNYLTYHYNKWREEGAMRKKRHAEKLIRDV
jgi:hypothetical protein